MVNHAAMRTPSGWIGNCDIRMIPGNPREVIVLADFAFRTEAGKTYWARQNDKPNGASIPRFAWRVVGSPYTGLYRIPAVLHDCQYARKEHPRAEVDWVFLESMAYEGVIFPKRILMYSVVRQFGPRWEPVSRFPDTIIQT